MPLERIVDGDLRSLTVRRFARSPANDNLTFATRVKAEIAEAARAAGVIYTERELLQLAADASEFARSATSRLTHL